jgi:phytoene synthase
MSETGNNRLFCWEQATKTNRLFRVTSVFADAPVKPMLPPLYALFSAVEQICSGTREESVAQQRLAWWYEEILQTRTRQSSHPVLMELSQTGAAERLTADSFKSLLNSAAGRLEAPSVTDISDLRRACQQAGWPMVRMELEISGCKNERNDYMTAVAQNVGLMQLLRESHANSGLDAWWWIPLNSLAKYGVSREEMGKKSSPEVIKQLLSELFGQLNATLVNSAPGSDISDKYNNIRHLFVINELYRRRIRRWSRVSSSKMGQQIDQLSLSELMAAWNAARKVSRQR